MEGISETRDRAGNWELAGATFYAFLVHSRSLRDIRAKYPRMASVPDDELESLSYDWPPILVDELKGVRTTSGENARGILVGVPHTPRMILKRPDLFRRKVNEAVAKTAEAGARIIGLGGWLPAFTGYGLDLRGKTNAGITTGHSYAAWTIAHYVEQAIEKGLSRSPIVAIVGAAGSTGSLTAEVLCQRGLGIGLLLIDLPQKIKRLERSAARVAMKRGVEVQISASLDSLVNADIVVMLTSSAESVLRPEHLKDGVVVIDDTQPRNTTEELLAKASVIDVLSMVPGLRLDYDLDIVNGRPDITFTCLAETAVLAANHRYADFSIGRPGVEKAVEIARLAEAVGIGPAPPVSFGKLLDAHPAGFEAARGAL